MLSRLLKIKSFALAVLLFANTGLLNADVTPPEEDDDFAPRGGASLVIETRY